MRADLQALIDYTGLSIGEAAAIIGIGHEALSRKLAGKPRYDVRQEEIDALARLAELQDRAITAAINQIEALNRVHGDDPEPVAVTLISYRSTDDMLSGEEWPTASAHRMVVARIKAKAYAQVDLVIFDPAVYQAWLGRRVDSRATRLEWANERAQQGVKFAIKYGVDNGLDNLKRGGTHALGWAAYRIGVEDKYKLLDSGETEI